MTRTFGYVVGGGLLLLALAAAAGAAANDASANDDRLVDAGHAPEPAPFRKISAMIPMRDGVRLETVIFVPADAGGPLPFLLSRSPYGVPKELPKSLPAPLAELAKDGYVFVWQNLRGRFASEGTFVMARPPRDRGDARAIDESTDAYDTIEWLLHNVPGNNGRAGMYGVSYSAWTTAMALIDPHPALKAASEQASPFDLFANDDFHHNGAFRLAYGFEYAAFLDSDPKSLTHFAYDRRDLYEWFLGLGPLGNVNARWLHGKVRSWNDFVAHPNRDGFWERRALGSYLKETNVPNLNVAGWWDQEDFVGPLEIYRQLERRDAGHKNHLLVGPWNHGGWWGDGRRLGPIDFGRDTGRDFAEAQRRWFAYWLHDKGTLDFPEAQVFETGSNVWRRFDRWPPDGVAKRPLYLRAGGRLSFEPPAEAQAFDAYLSDPQNPVPYRPRPIPPLFAGDTAWTEWLVQDQRFVDHRPDVLSYQTDVLDEDVVVVGDIVADVFASTSGTDGDWIVKLIDVYPEVGEPADKDRPDLRGYQLIIAADVLRGRFRDSLARPRPIPRDRTVEYKMDLHGNAHAFLKGHRIMVQIQSSWFPLIDRNPQTYVDSIFDARAADFVTTTQRVHRARRAPSAVVLPVVR
jgi:hypothetical protein